MKKSIVALFVLALVGCGKETPKATEKPTVAVEPSLYAKVASIDAGAKVAEDSSQTIRAKKSIQQAAVLCKLTEDDIAGKAVKVKSMLEEKKMSAQSVDVLEMIPLVFREKVNGDCNSILARYVTVRDSGMNHAQATVGLNGLINAITK